MPVEKPVNEMEGTEYKKPAKKKTRKKASKKSGIDGIETSLNAIMEMVVKQAEAITALQERKHDAKNNPVVIRQAYETEENETGNPEPRMMESTGPAELSLAPPKFKEVGRDGQPYSDDKLKLLAFMEDILVVQVADTNNDNQVVHVPVWNDGKVQYFIRNQPQSVKRKYVEVLARAKRTTFTQRKGKNFNGDDVILNDSHTALEYPFTVLEDPAGISIGSKGHRWLKGIQQEQ